MQRAHLKCRIVGIPRDQRKSNILSKLHKILAGYRILAVVFAISQVQDGGCVVGQKLKRMKKKTFLCIYVLLALSTFIQEESQGTLKKSQVRVIAFTCSDGSVKGTRNYVPE